jgi:hypothetical protein
MVRHIWNSNYTEGEVRGSWYKASLGKKYQMLSEE